MTGYKKSKRRDLEFVNLNYEQHNNIFNWTRK